jgi:hypothetical protein
MSSYASVIIGDGVFNITAHDAEDLRGRHYIEFRLVERDKTGKFVGYCAMGTRSSCESALRHRLTLAIAA